MGQIVINGKSINFTSGSSIVVNNGKIVVDGQTIHSGSEQILVEVHGDVNNLRSDNSVTVKGSVLGSVDAGNSVHCGDVQGDVEAGNSVHARQVKGKAKAGNSVKIF